MSDYYDRSSVLGLEAEIERVGRERDHLARECRHALLAAMGYIGGTSVLDRAGIERTIRRALEHPAIRAIGQPADIAIGRDPTPPGPPSPPLPRCARCGHRDGEHGVDRGPCEAPGCECRGYLFPEVA